MCKMKKVVAAVIALSILGLGLLTAVPDASAKRRCPPGFEDVNNVCAPK